MTRGMIWGWVITLVGIVVWAYGYFIGGHPPFINWAAYTPHWIAEYMPTAEAEIGILLMFLAMIPMYWPQKDATPAAHP